MAEETTIEEPLEDPQPPPELSEEARARRAAALAQVRQYGDPVLRSKARAVEVFDEELRRELARMGQLMEDSIGIGLAATQLGHLRRFLVYRVEHDSPVVALVNPELEWASNEQETAEEGCLSLVGIGVEVERPLYVRVRAQDEHGETRVIEAAGLEARVIQHEMDHLDGVLILDRTSRDQRKTAVRTLRERERAAATA
jgi:peptide deformylase